jgi:fructokinase
VTVVARPLVFGEVLVDCFPDGSRVLGGAPFNVAWHLQGLGLAPYLVSRVGCDPEGEQVLAAMHGWGLDAAGVERDPTLPTGQVRVSLTGDEPQYEILPDRAYDRIALDGDPPPPACVYHGSLALRDPASRDALRQLLERTQAPVFLDVNLRDPWWEPAVLERLLERARWCKLNERELACLGGPGDPEAAAGRLLGRHGMERVFVTRGAGGAFALARDGGIDRVAPPPGAVVVDTVGAGDGFAAGLIAGLLQGWPLPLTLARAQGLASAICAVRGAILTRRESYRGVLQG